MAENKKGKSEKAKPVVYNTGKPNEIEYEVHAESVSFRTRIVSYDESTSRISARAEILFENAIKIGKKKKIDVNYN